MDKNQPLNFTQPRHPRWLVVWQWLTHPSGLIQDVALRRKAAMLSGLLLLIFALEMASIIFRAFFFPDVQMAFRQVIIVLLLASIYLLSRTRHYQIAAGLTVFFYPVTVFTVVLSGASPIPELALMGLMIALFVGNLLLALPGLVALGVFNVVGMIIVVWLVPENFPHINFVPAIVLFNTIAAILAIVSRRLQQNIEQDRLATLQESEERFRQLAENIEEVFWIVTPWVTTIEYVSPTIEKVWGRPASEFYENADTYLQSIHPDDRETVVKPRLKQQALGEPTLHEYRIVRPDGTIRWIWDRGFSLKDESGQVYRVMGIAEDITERKQAEQQLRDNEKLLRALAEQFPRAYLSVINADLTIGFTSGQEFERYQFDPKLFVGLQVRDIVFDTYGDEEAVETIITAYNRTFAGQEQYFELSLGGEHLLFETRPLVNEQGDIHQILAVVQNLTERKQAETALRQSEERFSKVFSTNPNGLVLTRLQDGYIIDVNASAEQLLGYSRAEMIGHSTLWLNLYANLDDRPKLVKQLQLHGSLRDYELLARKKSGELLTLTVSIELIELDGEPHMISAIRDITEQKKVEAQLAYHAYIMENLAEGLNYVDDQGIIRFTNPAFDAMFGYKRGELIGQQISIVNDLPPAESQKFVADVLAKLQTKNVWEGEVRNRKKDGTSFVTQAKIQALTLGEQSYWVTFQEDITERKQAEEALRASEARYRALYNHSPVMMHSFDAEGRLVSVSDYWLEMMGYDREEVISQPATNYLTEEAQRYALQVAIPEFKKTGHVKEIPLQFAKKNGEVIDVLLSAVAEYDKDGNFERSMAVLIDVTERNQLEAQLRQAQKMEAVGQLTAGIAHDFNNLLTAINGFAELTQLALTPNDPLATNIGKILHSGQLATNLISQLMIFSHKQIIEPQVLNLNEVVNQTDKLLRRIIGEHIDLKTTVSPTLWSVKVDRTQLEQVIVNLAVNARDAMPEGGQLIIETANIALDANADRADHLQMAPGEYVLISVSDTGVGMSQTVQSRIFEPFFTTKERGRGTGLGLATVYGIVKQNSGGIQVYSKVGQGTTFKIYLPRTEEPDPHQAFAMDVADLPTGSETILLVEDDEGVRGLVSRVLEMQGYTVLAAGDGEEALQLAAHHNDAIDLVLTDVVMPGIHGRALAEQLNQRHPYLKVLYMSGYSDEEIAHHGVLNHGVAFLQKPFKFSVLAHKIRQVLDVPAPS
ncbi:MAG TPA: PAS domain S-box protein [Anaerolineae bacterium]|nr:PAS domain S-box protein [Anaerolineae bacterium]